MLSFRLVWSIAENARRSQSILPIPEYARLSQFSFVLEDNFKSPMSSLTG